MSPRKTRLTDYSRRNFSNFSYYNAPVVTSLMPQKGPKIAVTKGQPRGTFKITTLKKTKGSDTVTLKKTKGSNTAALKKKTKGSDTSISERTGLGGMTIEDMQKRYLQDKITALNSDIAKICSLAGTAGLSLGVVHKGETIIYSNFGHRNLEQQLRTDENSIYHIASVGKFITCYALGILVKDGELNWEDPVKLHLEEEFTHWNKYVEKNLTVLDCVTMQMGLVVQNRLWLGERGRMNFPPNDTFLCVSDLDPIDPPGTSWRYNNWGYAIAGKLTEKLSGQVWGDFLRERIFDPLGLDCTITDSTMIFPNTAFGYMPLMNGSSVLNGRPEAGDNCCQTGASGIQSSVKDLLIFYQNLFKDLSKPSSERHGPDIDMLTKRHVDLNIRKTGNDGKSEQSYSMGWVRSELPGIPSMNTRDTRIIGAAEDSTMLWHHNGNYPGYTAASYLLPSTQTAVVVLTNSVGKLEVPDVVAQMVIDTILNSKEKGAPPIDWVGDAAEAAKAYDTIWLNLPLRLLLEKPNNAKPLPLHDYIGRYHNRIRNFFLEIWYEPENDDNGPETLWMCMQGRKKEEVQRYRLKHYYEDIFSWMMLFNENAYRGRSPIPNKEFYLLRFVVDEDLFVTGLVWNSGDGDYLFPREKVR